MLIGLNKPRVSNIINNNNIEGFNLPRGCIVICVNFIKIENSLFMKPRCPLPE